jgi:class III poly(R)-hydroxyalkanoic acid synthase PhaE subunit
VLPGDFLEDLKPESLERVTDKFLSIPGVGYTRESQEQLQEGIRLWSNYQKVNMEYNHAMNAVSLKALDNMRIKIIDMAEHGKEINSLREIYDLLVDCNEAAYAEFTRTEVFSDLYGRLTNALMAVKHHGRHIIDEIQSALNMPTRRGMNTLQKRQQEMRRENKDTSRKIENLLDEINTLKKLMDGNGSNKYRKPAVSAPSSKKNTVDKRKANRKTVRRKAAKKATAGKKSKKKGTKKDNVIVIKI